METIVRRLTPLECERLQGFPDGWTDIGEWVDSKGKKHSADIRLTFKSGKRVIRIRDDCTHFDPLRYFELHESDDPASHIGIRMVMKSVKTANYVHSLGLNNLTLIL